MDVCEQLQRLVRIYLPAVILAGCCQWATAGQLNLIINGKAVHLGVPAGMTMNENNRGLGLQYDYELINDRWLPFTAVSGFIDSMNNLSYYAGGGLMRRYPLGRHLGTVLHFDAGGIAFLMTREDFNNRQPFPGILPAFSLGNREIALNLTYIPKVHPKLMPLWFFQLKVAL